MHAIAAIPVLLIASAAIHAQQAVSLPRSDGASTPAMVYEPTATHGCPPLALISPGAGGNEKGLAYLAQALADDGWQAIVLGHRESGMAALRQDMRRAHGIRRGVQALVADPVAYRDRLADIGAALAWSGQHCRAPFKALLGHSMGARTVVLEAGAGNNLRIHGADRFDAYVALSPPATDASFPPDAGRAIRAPMLMLTGTRDATVDGASHAGRARAFDALSSRCAWLGVVDGATHMNFAGVGFAARTAAENATTTLAIAFLDGLRAGHCSHPPAIAGTTISSK